MKNFYWKMNSPGWFQKYADTFQSMQIDDKSPANTFRARHIVLNNGHTHALFGSIGHTPKIPIRKLWFNNLVHFAPSLNTHFPTSDLIVRGHTIFVRFETYSIILTQVAYAISMYVATVLIVEIVHAGMSCVSFLRVWHKFMGN